jgi:hypothetical protein
MRNRYRFHPVVIAFAVGVVFWLAFGKGMGWW